jgi:hypothetical protein
LPARNWQVQVRKNCGNAGSRQLSRAAAEILCAAGLFEVQTVVTDRQVPIGGTYTRGIPAAPVRVLQIAIYIVVIAWGIRSASHILSVVLISLLLAYAFPRWLMSRFHLGKGLAIVLTVAAVIALYVVVSVALVVRVVLLSAFHSQHRIPYRDRPAGGDRFANLWSKAGFVRAG